MSYSWIELLIRRLSNSQTGTPIPSEIIIEKSKLLKKRIGISTIAALNRSKILRRYSAVTSRE